MRAPCSLIAFQPKNAATLVENMGSRPRAPGLRKQNCLQKWVPPLGQIMPCRGMESHPSLTHLVPPITPATFFFNSCHRHDDLVFPWCHLPSLRAPRGQGLCQVPHGEPGTCPADSPRPSCSCPLAFPQVFGFFKGMSFPLASIAVYNSVVFGVFSNTQRFLSQYHGRESEASQSHTLSDLLLASMVAGVVSVGLGTPVDLIKIRLQMQTQPFQEGKRRGGAWSLGTSGPSLVHQIWDVAACLLFVEQSTCVVV